MQDKMKSGATILVVDDDRLILQSCEDVLRAEDYRPILASSGEDGIERIASGAFDLIITDLKMSGKDGLDVLRYAKEREPDVPVVILTGYPTLTSAIESVRLGAFDYVCKPVTPDEMLLVVNRALEHHRLLLENKYLRRHAEKRQLFSNIIAHSAPMKEVLRQVERVAPTESTVLLAGESGTGKEILARAIHQGSRRKNKQFVVADCAALASSLLESELFGHVRGAFTGATANRAGLFQIAHDGTLFLDELANISPDIQGKLLRVLESSEYKPVGSGMMKKVDVRLIAATNRDLSKMIKEGSFREDLFYRLNVFPIQIPPLREREGDVEFLSKHFLKHFASRGNQPTPEFTEKAIRALKRHSWPGNVRELKNVIERIVIMTDGSVIEDTCLVQHALPNDHTETLEVPETAEDLKQAKNLARKRAVRDLERAFITKALRKSGGNVSRAARRTGMQRTYFQALMKRHGIHAEDHLRQDET